MALLFGNISARSPVWNDEGAVPKRFRLPAFNKKFSGDDVQALIAYLRTLKT